MDYYFDYDPYFDYFDGSYSDSFGAIFGIIFAIVLCFLFLFLIFLIVSYILQSFSVYAMAKKRNLRYPWLAWIPFANQYILGALINDHVPLGSLRLPYAAIILPLLSGSISLLSNCFVRIPFLGWFLIIIIIILSEIYQFAAFYCLYRIYHKKNAVLYLVLSIFFPVTIPFFIFSLKNRDADLSCAPAVKTYSQNPRALLSLSLGILSILSSFFDSGFMLGACAIIFGILSFKEASKQNQTTILSLLGIILGSCGILLKFLLPVIGLAFFHGHSVLNNLLDNPYINHSNYPFL